METRLQQYLDFAEAQEGLKFTVLTYENRYIENFVDYWKRSKIIRIRVPIPLLEYMIGLKSVSRLDSAFKKGMYVFLHVFFLLLGGLIHFKEVLKADKILVCGALVESIIGHILSLLARKKYAVRWCADLSDTMANIITKLVLRRASVIVVNGIDTKEKMLELTWLTREKIFVSKHAIDTDVFRPISQTEARRVLNLPLNKLIVLYAAALNEVKFCDLVVESISKVFQKNSDFFLVIIGEGPLGNIIKDLMKSNNANLLFINHFVHQKTLSLYINAADLVIGSADVCYPARLVLESLACGTPVLLFNAPVRVEKRETGLQFKIPLNNVFVIPPSEDEFVRFLLTSKEKILQSKDDKHIVEMSRLYILQNHEQRRKVEDDLRKLLT
ncbi:MAG: glycosyltransferase [Candidatus Baldrarchaeia archaeon]